MSKLRAVLVGMIPTGNPLACAYLKAAADSDPALLGRVETEILSFDRFSDAESIAEAVLAREPGLVGVSTYIWNSQTALRLSSALKRRRPEVFLVLGGPQVSWRTEDFFSAAPIDACVIGEGEETFRALLGARLDGRPLSGVDGILWREGASLRRNPPRAQIPDLGTLASPYLSGVVDAARHESLSFESSRGCPFDCSFCDWQKNQKVRNFPVDRVLEEIRLIARRRPDARVFFVDADLFLHKERARRLLPALLEEVEGTGIRFEFETNIGHWNDEMMRLANHPRVSLNFGVQSLNPKALRAANRDSGAFRVDLLGPALSRRERLAPRARVSPELIFGMPDDDLAHYRMTLDWALSARIGHVITTPFLALPGSPFSEDPGRWGIEFDPQPPYRLLRSATFSEADLAAARRASYAGNLGMSLGWHAVEALRCLGRLANASSPTPTLAAFEAFCAALESDGRFSWVEDYRERILRSLDFNLYDPCSPTPDGLLTRLSDPDPLIARDLPEILDLLGLHAASALSRTERAEFLPPVRRFLSAARSRFERRRLSSLSSFQRLLTALVGTAGRWLVIAPDEDREFYKPWTARGRRVALADPGDDVLRAVTVDVPALTLDNLDPLPALIAAAAEEGPFDGILAVGVWSYLSDGVRTAAFAAAASAVRAGGRLAVIDDDLGFHPFSLTGADGAPLWKREPPAPTSDFDGGAWRSTRAPIRLPFGGGGWSVTCVERLREEKNAIAARSSGSRARPKEKTAR